MKVQTKSIIGKRTNPRKRRLTMKNIIGIVLFVVCAAAIVCALAEAQSAPKTPELKIDPKRTAVLILHMMNEQLKYKAGVSSYGPEFAEENKKLNIIENTRKIIEASRAKNIPVIYVRMEYRPGYPEIPVQEDLPPGRTRMRSEGFYKQGSWNVQIVDELKPTEKDIVVVNHSASAFGHNELDIILRSKNIRYLVLAGLSTKTIVTCTAVEAYVKGYYNYVVKDCCNSRKEGENEFYAKEVLPAYSVVIDSNQYVSALEKIK
jgi:nicotinamidase-related amidase